MNQETRERIERMSLREKRMAERREQRVAEEKQARSDAFYAAMEDPRIRVLKQFISKYVCLKDEYLDRVAHYVLYTYRSRYSGRTPVLLVKGGRGVGKTRLVEVVGSLCLDPIAANSEWLAKALSRKLDERLGTLILDGFARPSKRGRYNTAQIVVAHPSHPAIIVCNDMEHLDFPFVHSIYMGRPDAERGPSFLNDNFERDLLRVRNYINAAEIRVRAKESRVVITEGEKQRLILGSWRINAVSI